MMKIAAFIVLLVAFVRCQDTLEEDSNVSNVHDRKEKRGILFNAGGSGLEGYSYLGPSSRGMNYRGYNPTAEFGYDGVNYGLGASNFAGGSYSGYQGYNQPYGQYPYRGGYPSSYSYQRQYSSPVNTYPLGGIGTVGPYGGAYGGIPGGFQGGFNRYPGDGFNPGVGGGLYNGGYQQQGFF